MTVPLEAFADAAIGVTIADVEGPLRYVNDRFCMITGYRQDELLGRPSEEFTHPEDVTTHVAVVGRVVAGEIPSAGLTTRYVRKDGAVVWVRTSVSAIRDADARPQSLVAFVEDISERKRAEDTERALADARRTIAESRDFALVAERITEAVCRLLDAPAAMIARVASDTGSLVVAATRGDTVTSGCKGVVGDGTRALLDVPVLREDRVIGVLRVTDRAGRVFDADSIRIASAFADEAAVALEHERLLDEATRRERETGVFASLAAALASAVDHDTMLERIAVSALELVDGDRVLIRLHDASAADAPRIRQFAIARDEASPRGRAPRIELRKGTGDDLEPIHDHGVGAMLTVPIRLDDRVAGSLHVIDDRPSRRFAERDETTLTTLASHAAVAIRTAELVDLEAQARQRAEQLSRELMTLQETERRELARELHDQLGQMLTALQLTLGSTLPSATDVAAANDIVVDLLRRVRGVSFDLRPPMLDDLGVVPALISHCERFSAQTGVHVTFAHGGLEHLRVPPRVETAIYRIAQEALTNVARHAGTSAARVTLSGTAGSVMLQIDDEGRGFRMSDIDHDGSGLSGMRARATAAGGELRIHTDVGAGVHIAVIFALMEGDAPGPWE